jgi:hypothetical protein
MRLAVGFAAAGLLIASMAAAATPDKGTVSKSSPKVEWGGDLTSSGVFYNAWAQDPSTECSQPACDIFTLTVADGGHNLNVTENNDSQNTAGGDPGCGLNIKFPDGSYQYTQGSCGPKTTLTVKLKNVKAGEYVIRTASSHACCGTEGYTASAFIPEAMAPAPAPAPGPAPAAPAPAAEAPQLTVKPTKASGRRITKAHKYTVKVSSTAPLNAVTARFLKGSKTRATAKLERLDGSATMVLKFARKTKIKKGSYTVTVSGTDDQGRVVTTSVKVKVKK